MYKIDCFFMKIRLHMVYLHWRHKNSSKFEKMPSMEYFNVIRTMNRMRELLLVFRVYEIKDTIHS